MLSAGRDPCIVSVPAFSLAPELGPGWYPKASALGLKNHPSPPPNRALAPERRLQLENGPNRGNHGSSRIHPLQRNHRRETHRRRRHPPGTPQIHTGTQHPIAVTASDRGRLANSRARSDCRLVFVLLNTVFSRLRPVSAESPRVRAASGPCVPPDISVANFDSAGVRSIASVARSPAARRAPAR